MGSLKICRTVYWKLLLLVGLSLELAEKASGRERWLWSGQSNGKLEPPCSCHPHADCALGISRCPQAQCWMLMRTSCLRGNLAVARGVLDLTVWKNINHRLAAEHRSWDSTGTQSHSTVTSENMVLLPYCPAAFQSQADITLAHFPLSISMEANVSIDFSYNKLAD